MTAWDIRGKHVLITGASAGIGRATALALAGHGARLTLAGRSEPRLQAVLGEIEGGGGTAELLLLDLAVPHSVRQAAQQFLATNGRLDVLINNAGVGGTRGITADGFEITFATNHLGHHLLTRWLEPRLVGSAPSRMIVVASSAHRDARVVKWDRLRGKTSSMFGASEYRTSKLANILDARRWARRFEGAGVDVHIVHPGLVASEIWRDLPLPLRMVFARKGQTNEEGADTSIWAATDPSLTGVTGRYYANRAERRISDLAADDALGAEMWDRTEEWLAEWLPPDNPTHRDGVIR